MMLGEESVAVTVKEAKSEETRQLKNASVDHGETNGNGPHGTGNADASAVSPEHDSAMKRRKARNREPRPWGNQVLVCGPAFGSHFPFQVLIGPDWFCSMFTLVLLIGISVAWLWQFAYESSLVLFAFGILSTCVTVFAYLLTAWSDPGVVPRDVQADMSNLSPNQIVCPKCNVVRPGRRTQHCYSCNVCVEELDHHCPWVGKCIGKRTIRYFHTWLKLLGVHTTLVIVSFVVIQFTNAD